MPIPALVVPASADLPLGSSTLTEGDIGSNSWVRIINSVCSNDRAGTCPAPLSNRLQSWISHCCLIDPDCSKLPARSAEWQVCKGQLDSVGQCAAKVHGIGDYAYAEVRAQTGFVTEITLTSLLK